MSAVGPAAVAPAGIPTSIQIGGGGPAPQPSGGDGFASFEFKLKMLIELARKLATEAPDYQESNVIDKCVVALSGIASSRQSGAESALGITPAHKAMSRVQGAY